MSELKPVSKQRPYFIWDYDFSEEDVRAILAGDNEYEKVQMMVRIMESARYEDIWTYITLKDVQEYWTGIAPRMRREVRDVWEWALKVWSREN
jgi:hypothetical protein